jgi:hypothetical protein
MNGFLASADWSLGFNDPTVIGWLVTGGYFAVSILCVFAAGRHSFERVIFLSWLLLGLVLVLLCLNKQLDLQTLFKEWFDRIEVNQDWSGQRRMVIGYSLAGASAIIAVVGAMAFRRLPRQAGNLRWAIVCLGCLLVGLMLQYLPLGSFSGELGLSIFGASDGVWQVELMELLEIVFLALIGLSLLAEIRKSEVEELK